MCRCICCSCSDDEPTAALDGLEGRRSGWRFPLDGPGLRATGKRLANRFPRFPIYRLAEDGPSLRYMRHWIETGHARLGKPLKPKDLKAFDRLDATLNDPHFRHDLRLSPGDRLFCDNHKTAHEHESYRDDPTGPRLML